MKRSAWFTWLLAVVGGITAFWGVAMLVAGRSSPDPINPVALVVVTLAGSLLLYLADASRRSRRSSSRDSAPE